MRTEIHRMIGTSLLLAAAASTVRGQDALADRFPADAILYVEADTTKTVDGALNLDLVKLLDEPQVQEFLKPIAADLPAVVSTQGLRQLIDAVPWRKYVNGRVQMALRGAHVEINGQSFDVSPSQPITARQINRLGGLAASHHGLDDDERHAGLNVSIAPDLVLCMDVGDDFAQFFDTAIGEVGAHSGMKLATEACKIGGHDATKMTLIAENEPSHAGYVVRDGKRWWIGGSSATLEQCMNGGVKESLARSAAFQNWKKQASGGDAALLAYVNIANAARMFERLIPPIVKEELDLFGISSVESLGYASTFVEGGVRDSLVLSYSAPPTGFLSLLNCCDGGFDFLKKAPADTGFYLGARIDAEAFVDKLVKVTEELFPGTSVEIEHHLAAANREIGMDLRQELLPAFGNEIGLYLTPPGSGSVLPEGMLMMKVGDREQFAKLIARARSEAEKVGEVQFSDLKTMPDGAQGWAVTIKDAPVQPAFALTNDLFCVAMNALSLKKALHDLSTGLPHCACDNANLQRVLKGLTGSPSAAGLKFLAFADVQRAVQIGYQFAGSVSGAVQNATGGKLDMAALPEAEVIAHHFSGIGIGGRSDEHGLSLSFFTPTGLTTGAMAALPWLFTERHQAREAAMNELHAQREKVAARHARAETAKTPPSEPANSTSRTRSLADLFASIEKATGATIDFPDEMASMQVSYTPKSGDLETILADLGKLVGFSYTVRDVDGEKLVIVTNG